METMTYQLFVYGNNNNNNKKTPDRNSGAVIPLCEVQTDSFMAESNDAAPCQSLGVRCSVPRMLNVAPARETNGAEG